MPIWNRFRSIAWISFAFTPLLCSLYAPNTTELASKTRVVCLAHCFARPFFVYAMFQSFQFGKVQRR